MKLVLDYPQKTERYDLDDSGAVYFNVTDVRWLKVYKIGDEIMVCFDFETPEHPEELIRKHEQEST